MGKSGAIFITLVLVFIAGPTVMVSAGGTKVIHSWVFSGPMPKLHKILVVAELENYLIRQYLEDEMERLLAQSGVNGVRGHMVLPPRNELTEGELKERIKASALQGVLIIRLKDIREEHEEIVTNPYVPPKGYFNLGPYLASHIQTFHTRSYSKSETIVRVECNLYGAQNENLLWSGETNTVYSKNFQKLAEEYAKALVNQLKKDRAIVR